MFQQMIVPTNIETTRKYYATNEELIQDIGVAYQDVIKQFYKAGCRNLQLDDCSQVRSWEMLRNKDIKH